MRFMPVDVYKRQEYDKVFDEFDKTVGFGFLCAIHLNDSKKALGSRVDPVSYTHLSVNTYDKRLPALKQPPLVRENRLYQADWLLRFYQFKAVSYTHLDVYKRQGQFGEFVPVKLFQL